MALKDIFYITAAARSRRSPGATGIPGEPPPKAPVFLSPQSLSTFAGATVTIEILWKFGVYFGLFPDDVTWPLAICALVVGAVVFLISISEPEDRPGNTLQWVIAIFIGVVNSAYLCLAALGIDAVMLRFV